MFENGFANREEMGCQASNIGVSEQEMVSIRAVLRTFLLRAASFGNRRFLGSDARRISKFFAIA